ncbi:MAG: XRE family transcriptional regulator [Verrucomicrobiae bacterium]|nr:XRE family transcriptional regulator [Verrucomicrobiae bacterium]
MNFFGDRLKSLRGNKTQAEFAEFLSINSAQTYGRYEKGRIPDAETLGVIANRCGCSVDWLLGRSDNQNGEPKSFACEEKEEPRISNGRIYPSSWENISQETLEEFLEVAVRRKDYVAVQVMSQELAARKG